jgi:hypothetical protein
VKSGLPDLKSSLGFQYATVGRWAQAIPERLEPGDWLARPAGFRNPPHWIYGHVAVSSDVMAGVRGLESLVPEAWRARFDQGTAPDPEGEGYPAPAELRDLLARTMARNLEGIAALDPSGLAEPIGVQLDPSLQGFLKTRERWLAFAPLHLAYHLGQIQMIQRVLHPETRGL